MSARHPRTVLYVNSWSSAHGGSSTSLIDVVGNLDPERYRSVVMCPNEGELPERLRELGMRVLVRGIHRPTREELHRFVVEVPLHWRWLRSEGIDLVHGNTSASRRSIVQAAVSAGIPYIQHVRNVARNPAANYGYRMATKIVCNSDATAEVFRAEPSLCAKTMTIYNAVDLARYETESDTRRAELGVDASRPIVGFVGQIVPRKGLTTLIEAIATVATRVPDVLLLVLGTAPPGEPEYEAECRRLVSALGLEQQVRFLGYRRDVPAFMRTFDVFALPTRSEPFGKVVIEAMAASCPVVTTRVGGIPEIVTSPELGTLIQPDDAAALSTALLDFLLDPGRRAAFGARGRASARDRFGMETMLHQLQALYDDVLSGVARAGAASALREEGAA